MKARRYGIAAGLIIVAGITSGALLAQAPQQIGTWVSVGETSSPLTNGAAVALSDNRTLIVGGKLPDSTLTDVVTVYDSVDGSATAAGTLTNARADHTATLLKDGRVLVAGGMTADGLLSSDIEVFDPATGSSMLVALLPEPRTGLVAAGLPDGSVLIAGGVSIDGTMLQTAVLFDPETNSVSSVPDGLHTPRVHASATTMLDGRVLVAGGSNGTTELASAEIYDRYSQSFSMAATQMSVGRQGHSAVLLPHNGGVLIAGGTSNGVAQAGVDLFLPAVFPDPFSFGEGEFASTGAMTAARSRAVAGPTSVEGYAFAAAGGPADAEVYRFATIKTDKDDYAPGELATITGSGWQPNEKVTLLFQEDPAVHDDYVLEVNADGSGNISWNQWAPEQHDFGVRFYLTATGSKSMAQTTFTDGNKVTFSTTATGAAITNFGTVSLNQCVNAYVQERQGNNPDVANPARTVTLSSTPSGTSFFVGLDCDIPVAPPSTVTIALNASSVAFSFKIATASATPYIINGNGGLTGNNNASASITVTAGDTTKPTVTISSLTSNSTNASPIPVSVTFSEPVTGFTVSDLSIGNGTAANFSGSGTSYTFNLTPSSDGLVTVNIAANIAQDAASNGNEAATEFSRTSDRTAPSISATPWPVANPNGWNNTDVTASYTASDAGSGLAAGSPASGTFTFTTEAVGQSHTFTVFDQAGNSASATVSDVNIDKTAPSTTATPAPAANAAGWNNTDVTVTFAGTDSLSGIDTCDAAALLSSDGNNLSTTGSCSDKAGNSASATASGIKIDKTSPSITVSRVTPANSYGWNNTDVTISYVASDALSQLNASSPATGSYIFTAEGAGQSYTFTVTDQAGNSASATVSDVNIDTTAPSVTATAAPAGNAAGWNNTDVTVTFTGTDALSQIATCDAAAVLSSEGNNLSTTGSCSDKAGNSASATVSGIKIDKTAPSITASRVTPANSYGWNNTDVTISYVAGDALSQLNASSPATGSYSFTVEGAGQSHTFTVTDQAGNSASATVSGINIDKTAPTLAPVVSPNPVLLNGTATATPNATDALSGIQTQSCPAVSTSSVGARSVTCTATDKAGNDGTSDANYAVHYSWKGFLQPINDTAHQIGATQSRFKLGQTVPAKFVLRDAAGVSVQQESNPAFLISGNLGACASYATLETTDAGAPDTLPVYKWDGAQYHFNWSTKGLSGGVYRIYANLADGNQPWVDICLTK